MVLIELGPEVSALVPDVVCRYEPVFRHLKLIAEAPLLRIGGTQIQREVDVDSTRGKGLVLGGRKRAGEGIPTRVAGVGSGQSAGRAGNGDLVAPRRSIRKLGVEERVGPVVENPVGRANALTAVALRIPRHAD